MGIAILLILFVIILFILNRRGIIPSGAISTLADIVGLAAFIYALYLMSAIPQGETPPMEEPPPPLTQSPTSSSTAIASLTPTPTLLPTVSNTSFPSLTISPAPEGIIYQDNFSDNLSGAWVTGSFGSGTGDDVARGEVYVADGKFILDVTFLQTEGKWSRVHKNLLTGDLVMARDFDLTVTSQIENAGDIGNLEIVISFRIVGSQENHYSLRFSQGSGFALFLRLDGEWKLLSPYIVNLAIKPLNEVNIFRIFAQGSVFEIYANEEKILEFVDDELFIMEPGGFAIGARGVSIEWGLFYFDDLLIIEVQP